MKKQQKELNKRIKELTKVKKIDDSVVYMSIQAVSDAYKKAKSPIDEELTFWMMVYSGLYDLSEDEIISLYKPAGAIEFILASRKILFKREEVQYMFDACVKFKKANHSNSVVSGILDMLGDPKKIQEMMEALPPEVKELIKKEK